MKRRYGYPKEKEWHAKKHDPKKEREKNKGDSYVQRKYKIEKRGVTQKRSQHTIIHPHTCTS
jgi:hypothetical protein